MSVRVVSQTKLYHHLIAKIQQSTISEEPFYHTYFTELLPPELYPLLLEHLPKPELYAPMGKDNTRSQFIFTPENQAKLPDKSAIVWLDVYQVLNEPGFRQNMLEKFSVGIAERMGIQPDEVLDKVDCVMDIRLMRDVGGYTIKPHRDTLSKIITMQIYLPPDDSMWRFGTSLYLPSEDEAYTEVKRFQYMPNTGYAFVVSNGPQHVSWHGVEPIPADFKGVRNSMLVMFQNRGAK